MSDARLFSTRLLLASDNIRRAGKAVSLKNKGLPGNAPDSPLDFGSLAAVQR